MKKLNIYLNYDGQAILGTIELNEDGEKTFATGQYCIVPKLMLRHGKIGVVLSDEAGMVLTKAAIPFNNPSLEQLNA